MEMNSASLSQQEAVQSSALHTSVSTLFFALVPLMGLAALAAFRRMKQQQSVDHEMQRNAWAMFAATGSKKVSQRKRDRVNERNHIYNSQWKSRVKTATKRFLEAMQLFDSQPSMESRARMAQKLAEVYKVCDKCKVKGVLHVNTAPRAFVAWPKVVQRIGPIHNPQLWEV